MSADGAREQRSAQEMFIQLFTLVVVDTISNFFSFIHLQLVDDNKVTVGGKLW
jgi:hypothetical protein